MIDYHMHLERGPMSLSWLKEFSDQAQKRGLQEFAITEHAHRFKEFYPVYKHLLEGDDAYAYMQDWMAKELQLSLVDYFALLEEARSEGIPVKFGIETDYFLGQEENIRSLLSDYPFDFVLGSVHFIGKWGFDYSPNHGWQGRDHDTVYREYISLLEHAVKANLFDCLAHLDVIKVFGHRPTGSLEKEWQRLLELIAMSNLAIEISTAGLRKPVGEIYPAPPLIAKAAELGIPITIASDAHEPQDVGHKWELAVELAKSHGYSAITIFEKRRPQKLAI